MLSAKMAAFFKTIFGYLASPFAIFPKLL